MAKQTETETQTAPPPDPWMVLQDISKALTALAARPASSSDTALIETLNGAMNRIADAQESGSALIAMETKRAHRPSNEVVPRRSVYNPRGYEYAVKLKCRMMIPWLAEEENLFREEIELLNLLEDGEYIVRLIDNEAIRMEVKIERSLAGTPLVMNHPSAFNNDNKDRMPALVNLLRQMLQQHSADIKAKGAAVLSMDEENALIAANQLAVTV
jgi:hypothetical protein